MREWVAELRARYPTANVQQLVDMDDDLLRETWEAVRDIYETDVRLSHHEDREEMIVAILEARCRFLMAGLAKRNGHGRRT